MICPGCGTEGAYVGLQAVECCTVGCKHGPSSRPPADASMRFRLQAYAVVQFVHQRGTFLFRHDGSLWGHLPRSAWFIDDQTATADRAKEGAPGPFAQCIDSFWAVDDAEASRILRERYP